MRWALHHRDHWPDLDRLQEPARGSYISNIGAFILADPFETILRHLSVDYLQSAWSRVAAVLGSYRLAPVDLSWGWLHAGVTAVPGLTRLAPSDFVGWTSHQLAEFDQDQRYAVVDAQLRSGSPKVCWAATFRSLKWRIAPDAYPLALRLIEACCTDEYSDWAPEHVLAQAEEVHEPWIEIAQAILDRDQERLNRGVAAAQRLYSPLGYRIVMRGYGAYIEGWKETITVRLPD